LLFQLINLFPIINKYTKIHGFIPLLYQTLFKTILEESDVISELTRNCNFAKGQISQILQLHNTLTFAQWGKIILFIFPVKGDGNF